MLLAMYLPLLPHTYRFLPAYLQFIWLRTGYQNFLTGITITWKVRKKKLGGVIWLEAQDRDLIIFKLRISSSSQLHLFLSFLLWLLHVFIFRKVLVSFLHSALCSFSIVFLFCSYFLTFRMESCNRSYKKALVDAGSSSQLTSKTEENKKIPLLTSSKAKEADEVIEALLSPNSAEEAFEEDNTDDDEDKEMEKDAYIKQLVVVRQDVQKFKEIFLLGAIWNGQVDIQKLKQKLKIDWKFIKRDFEVVDRTNGWVEFQFVGSIERNLVWEHRPYHVFGHLLVLIPWRPSFDAYAAQIERLDLWIRIPFLPTEYMSKEIIKAIIQYNKVGKFIKLDPFSESRSRPRYARICVNVKNSQSLKGYVEVPDCSHKMKEYNVWYEDILEGCRHCGKGDHKFEVCPLRSFAQRVHKITVEKSPIRTLTSTPHIVKEDVKINECGEEQQNWKIVADIKGKKPLIIRKPKPGKPPRMNPSNAGIVIRSPCMDLMDSSLVKEMADQHEEVRERQLEACLEHEDLASKGIAEVESNDDRKAENQVKDDSSIMCFRKSLRELLQMKLRLKIGKMKRILKIQHIEVFIQKDQCLANWAT